jgi:hypothetical protein
LLCCSSQTSFTAALNEVGLPQSDIPVALLFFNVSVEAGQLLFIASVFTIIALASRVNLHIEMPQPAWAWRIPRTPSAAWQCSGPFNALQPFFNQSILVNARNLISKESLSLQS